MDKLTEVWSCDFVPKKIPGFIDPHITVDNDGIKDYFLIEVNPLHGDVRSSELLGETREKLLTRFGVVNPQLIYRGQKPKGL